MVLGKLFIAEISGLGHFVAIISAQIKFSSSKFAKCMFERAESQKKCSDPYKDYVSFTFGKMYAREGAWLRKRFKTRIKANKFWKNDENVPEGYIIASSQS